MDSATRQIDGQVIFPLPYKIIDADAHVVEPPDLWQSRVPARLRERAPRVVKLPNGGDAWSFDGGKPANGPGLFASAGRSFVGFKTTDLTYEQIRPGCFHPHERLKDMDIDGIHAQVLYPSITLLGAKTFANGVVRLSYVVGSQPSF